MPPCRSIWRVLLVVALALPPGARAAVLHVAPAGKSGAPGTAEAPLASVQAALDRAKAGDTVHVAPGVYRERVAFKAGGEFGQPVTLEGEPGAVLDGSEPVTLDWQPAPDVAPGAYRARVAFPVFTVVAEGRIVTMLREDRVRPGKAGLEPEWEWPNIFKHGVGPSGWEGVKALALYRKGSKELLVRFRGDLDPRRLAISVAPKEPCVWIGGASRCVVRGLTLRNAAYGVLVTNSLGSVVEQCVIGPADYGVWLEQGADRCTVRGNEIFMNPYAGADPQAPGAWDNWLAHKSGGYYDRYGVQIAMSLGGHEVHDNFIHDHWDGIEDRGDAGQSRGLRIHHNRILCVSDDGLEPNGAEIDCRWHDNLVEHARCGFRIKSPQVGPLYAYRNIFFDNNEDFRNYGEVEPQPAIVYVYHNTCTAKPAIESNKVLGIGTPNYHYYNNLFWCAYWWGNSGHSVEPNWQGDGNVYVRRDQDSHWETTRALAAQRSLDAHSLWTNGSPGFVDFAARDVSLQTNSPALHRGIDLSKLVDPPWPGCEPGYFSGPAPDAGAVPLGQPMPRAPRTGREVYDPPAGVWPAPDPVVAPSAAR